MDELDPEDYTVAWLAPLEIEARAALHSLDHQHHGRFPLSRGNDYVFQAGEAGGHNVIIATLPAGQAYGTGSAASLAGQVKSFFPNLWFGLLVGVAAGLPSSARDIRLGDVLVGVSKGDNAGLVAYDLGKETDQNGFQILRSGRVLAETETVVRSAIRSIKLQSPYESEILEPYYRHIRDKIHPNSTFSDPGQENDILYQFEADGTEYLAPRKRRPDTERTRVWYGSIGSGEKLMRNARIRDKLRDEHNIMGLEMEAAGTMTCLPVGVIRGVCDYGDGHKSKEWQPYAAAMAAAYARTILAEIRPKPRLPRKETTLQSTAQPLDKMRLKDRLDSLWFEQIDFRLGNIKQAHINTCQWLLEKSEYRDWLDPGKLRDHHGFLWIKGKPGAGKSTLMKFILNHAQDQMKDKIILSFFFNARGGGLEKSTAGMYRSLLWQLLKKLPHLEKIIFPPQSLERSNMSSDWSLESLKFRVEKSVQQLGQFSLICLIDALDECNEQQIRDMTSFLGRLGDMTVSSDIAFRVCFASRHYPHISISKGQTLILEGQEGHDQDIVRYLDSELRIGSNSLANQIRLDVYRKSAGIFMWVILVVRILQQEYDDGRKHMLRRRLREIPGDLHELFRDIATRDHRNKGEFLLCTQWLLFASRPLDLKELYFAILCGIDPAAVSAWECDEIEEEDMKRFIISSSKGLAEVADTTYDSTVQFIHESVKDFFLKENELGELWPGFKQNVEGESHERLKQCCLDYMRIGFACPAVNIPMAFPFLSYAAQNVLFHSNEAEGGGISQTSFLRAFPLTDWNERSNVLALGRYNLESSLLYILAEKNLVNLLEILPHKLSSLEVECGRYGPPLFAALACGSYEAVWTLLKARAASEPLSSPLHSLCEQYRRENHQWSRFDESFEFSPRRGFLSHLAQNNEKAILNFVLVLGTHDCEVNIQGDGKHAPLLYAMRMKDAGEIIQLLINKGAAVNAPDRYGKTPMWRAVEFGSQDVIRQLLDNDAAINAVDPTTGNSLIHLVFFVPFNKDILELLLDRGADVNASNNDRRTPLFLAVRGRGMDMMKLLLKRNATVNVADSWGRSPLTYASMLCYPEAVRLLLDYGAEADMADGDGRTPLFYAVQYNQGDIVELLRNRGAKHLRAGEKRSRST